MEFEVATPLLRPTRWWVADLDGVGMRRESPYDRFGIRRAVVGTTRGRRASPQVHSTALVGGWVGDGCAATPWHVADSLDDGCKRRCVVHNQRRSPMRGRGRSASGFGQLIVRAQERASGGRFSEDKIQTTVETAQIWT